jgi:hypothetical protein
VSLKVGPINQCAHSRVGRGSRRASAHLTMWRRFPNLRVCVRFPFAGIFSPVHAILRVPKGHPGIARSLQHRESTKSSHPVPKEGVTKCRANACFQRATGKKLHVHESRSAEVLQRDSCKIEESRTGSMYSSLFVFGIPLAAESAETSRRAISTNKIKGSTFFFVTPSEGTPEP